MSDASIPTDEFFNDHIN